MRGLKQLVFGMGLSALVLVCVSGCAKTEVRGPMQGRPSLQEKMNGKPYIILLYEQPDWLLIGGQDRLSESGGGDLFTVTGDESNLDDHFHFINYAPNTAPLKLQVVAGNRIVYWEGNGEIINNVVHEKVIVPLKSSE